MSVRSNGTGWISYAVPPPWGGWAVAFWFQRVVTSSAGVILFAIGESPLNALFLTQRAPNLLRLEWDASGGGTADITAALPAAPSQYFIAVRSDGVNVTARAWDVHGQQVGATASLPVQSLTPNFIVLFNRPYSSSSIPDAGVQHFRVWDSAVTLDELKTEMWSRVAVRRAALRLDWPLTHAATSARDYSGNSRIGSVNGTLSTESGVPLPPWNPRRALGYYALAPAVLTLVAAGAGTGFAAGAAATELNLGAHPRFNPFGAGAGGLEVRLGGVGAAFHAQGGVAYAYDPLAPQFTYAIGGAPVTSGGAAALGVGLGAVGAASVFAAGGSPLEAALGALAYFPAGGAGSAAAQGQPSQDIAARALAQAARSGRAFVAFKGGGITYGVRAAGALVGGGHLAGGLSP